MNESPTRPQIEAVAREAVALRQLRREVMAKMQWPLLTVDQRPAIKRAISEAVIW